MLGMLGISDLLFGSDKEILVDHYAVNVERRGEEVNFESSFRSERNAELVMDEESYEIDSEMTFSLDYLKSENAVVVNSDELLHSFSTEEVDECVNLVFSKSQISEIQNITLNRDENVLNPNSEYEINVFIAGEIVIVSIEGFYVNNSVRMDVEMSGSYPSISIRTVSPDNQFFDFSSMEKRKVRFESDVRFSGDAKFKGDTLDFTTGNTYNIGCRKKMYCESDEITGRIEKWNDTELGVEVYPDSYRPIIVKPDRVVDGEMVLSITNEELTPLSEIKVNYPDWVVGIDPRLRYDIIDPRSKYSKRKKVGKNEYVFENVIPSEDLRLFHGGGVMRFEENIREIEGVEPDTVREFNVDLTPRKKGIIINSKREEVVNFIIDGQSKQLKASCTDVVEVEPSTVTVTVKSTENELIDEITILEGDLLETREIVLVNNNLSVN